MNEPTPGPWLDGGDYGPLSREVQVSGKAIATVWIKRMVMDNKKRSEPELDPEGVANFRLILNAPKLLEALEAVEWTEVDPDPRPCYGQCNACSATTKERTRGRYTGIHNQGCIVDAAIAAARGTEGNNAQP